MDLSKPAFQHDISLRSIVIGLACVVLFCIVVPYNDFLIEGTFLAGNRYPSQVDAARDRIGHHLVYDVGLNWDSNSWISKMGVSTLGWVSIFRYTRKRLADTFRALFLELVGTNRPRYDPFFL